MVLTGIHFTEKFRSSILLSRLSLLAYLPPREIQFTSSGSVIDRFTGCSLGDGYDGALWLSEYAL